MSIVPVISSSTNETQSAQTAAALALMQKETLAFDWTTKRLIIEDGKHKKVSGVDALKEWITKTIHTARYRWSAYTSAYGTELEDAQGYVIAPEVLKSELKRAITEALLMDPRISAIKNFTASVTGSLTEVNFEVVTCLGEEFSYSQEVS